MVQHHACIVVLDQQPGVGELGIHQRGNGIHIAYNISRSYVSRIEKKALGKLEQALREYL